MSDSSSDARSDLQLPQSFSRLAPHIERALDEWIPEEDPPDDPLARAMRYSVFSGGKRVRPVLALLACEVVSGEFRPALPAACAVECVHTYSLIHDDLPCMDDDDLRRGKPTNHRVFGEAVAVLAGDALQARAFEVLSDPRTGYSPAQVQEMIAGLARAAGSGGMVGGQVRDIAAAARDVDALTELHARKTGALFCASLDLGALAGGASDEQRASLRAYARSFGLAFQITDDILDVIGDPDKTGRYAGSDREEDRCTYPAVVGLEESRRLARRAVDEGACALAQLAEDTRELENILHFVLSREG